jgi:hypothetical protein
LIEFYKKAAHVKYVEDVQYFIQEAKKYRLTIIGEN